MKTDNRHDQGDNSDEKKKVLVSGNLSVELKDIGVNKIVDAIKKETTTEQQTENRSNVIQFRQLQQQIKSNKISITANLIGLIMFAATVCVFVLNIKAISAANKSADAAIKADSIAANNFDLGNRPFVVSKNVSLTELAPNSDIRGSITAINYGKTPAFILYEATHLVFSNLPELPVFIYTTEDYKPMNYFIIDSLNISIPFRATVSKQQYTDMLNQKLFLFIHGRIIYRSVIKNGLYEYDYCYSILDRKRFRPTPNHNTVKEIQYDSIPDELRKSGFFGN